MGDPESSLWTVVPDEREYVWGTAAMEKHGSPFKLPRANPPCPVCLQPNCTPEGTSPHGNTKEDSGQEDDVCAFGGADIDHSEHRCHPIGWRRSVH